MIIWFFIFAGIAKIKILFPIQIIKNYPISPKSMKQVLLCLALLAASVCLYAQSQYELSGTVKAADTKLPLDYASVVIVNNESGVKKFLYTDTLGRFSLELAGGRYFLEVSYTGYEKQQHQLEIAKDSLFNVGLTPSAEQLAAAVIEASRVEHNMEGFKFRNISKNKKLADIPLPNILMTTPGVWAANNSISVYGKQATVYLDNRLLSAQNLSDFLNSYSGKNIKEVEVISDPGYEYGDAAAVIKITTNIEQGGRLISDIGYDGFTEKKDIFRHSDIVTYKRGNTVTDANLAYMYMNIKDLYTDNTSDATGEPTGIRTTESNGRLPYSVMANMGLTHNFNRKSFLSMNLNGRFLKRKEKLYERDLLNDNPLGNSNSNTLTRNNTVNFSALYSNTFENDGKLEIRANYFYADKKSILTDTLLHNGKIRSTNGTNTSNAVAVSSNYTTTLFTDKDKFTGGIDYSYISNNVIDKRLNMDKEGLFEEESDYDETLVYGFFNYTYPFENVGIRLGGRAEYSYINGTSFFNFRPDLLLTFYLNKKRGNILRLNYSRGAIRPTVSHLDPTPYYIDNTVYIGNPGLDPAFRHSTSLGFTLRNKYTISANYSYTSDIITSYSYTSDDILYSTYINGSRSQTAGLSLQANINPFNWWSLNFNVSGAYSKMEGEEIETENTNYSINAMSLFFFGRGFTATAICFYNSSSIKGLNAKERMPVYVTLKVSKSVLKNKLKLSLDCSDLFNSDKNRTMKYNLGNGVVRETKYGISSRTFGISLSYNFNWGERVVRQMKNYGNQEISNRLSSGN